MRNPLLFIFLGAFLIFSCSKEHKAPLPGSADKLYKVQFNLSGFTQQKSSVNNKVNAVKSNATSADSSDTDSLDVLYFLVYNSAGQYVHRIIQHSTSGSFTGFSDNLQAGSYNVYFVAGKTGLLVDTVKAQFYYSAPGDSLGNWHDTFYKQLSLNVTGNDNENVKLDRFVSALRINITDAIPANAAKIVTSIQYEYIYYSYLLNKNIGYNTRYIKTLTTPVTPSMVGKTNIQQYSVMSAVSSVHTVGFFNDYRQLITISCYDTANNLIGNAVVPLVRFEPNQETILTGKLFHASNTGNAFKITVNNAWNPTPFQTINF